MIIEIIGLIVIIFLIFLCFTIIETNQIAKRNYEKLDKIISLLKKDENKKDRPD